MVNNQALLPQARFMLQSKRAKKCAKHTLLSSVGDLAYLFCLPLAKTNVLN